MSFKSFSKIRFGSTIVLIAIAIGFVGPSSVAGKTDSSIVGPKKKSARPNIVFIMTDDHRWDGYRSSGNQKIQTPNLDRIAIKGTRFDNAFVTLAICSPSRAACLTGQYGSSNGVMAFGKVPLNDSRLTFAHDLKQAGYRTGVAGKWHLGSSPQECGFEFTSTCWSNGTWYGRKFTIDGKTLKVPGFVDDVTADESLRFIRESVAEEKPFVLWMCTQVPHMDHKNTWPAKQECIDQYSVAQMALPQSWNDDLSSKPSYLKTARNRTKAIEYGYENPGAIRKHARDYYASVQQMDAAVGRVLDELDREELRDNTWIILMGDNGWMLGEHGMTSKVLPYEESMRVPMAIAGPRAASQVRDELVLNIDLTATIYELAGLSVPESLHGRSLLPIIKGKKLDDWRQSFLYEAPLSQLGSQPLWAVRTDRWKYIETHVSDASLPFVELYDMESDSIEMNNLAESPDHQQTRSELANELVILKKRFAPDSKKAEQQATAKNSVRTDLQISGVYPHLTMRNNENECGTGAIVPWGGDLWAVTYAPHAPNGSSDKLYQITPELKQIVRDESIGGTPANRMIHRETNQLLIGPHVIDADKNIRTIPSAKLFGRLTGNARHLVDPVNKVYYATMEEGLYEVDLNSLDAECLITDGHGEAPKADIKSELPGYHGKGLYSGQGRLLYSNNGEHGKAAKEDPTTPSGALAQWFGEGDWQLVRRNQFTEITGPGGIYGNANVDDPVWAMGWDAKSLILAVLEDKQWHYYRLPKASHSYDGAHGWNTEWPRIRDIGEEDLLATMHGTFWRFPKTFSRNNSAGITPRSNYLKVIGDFCQWNGKVVLGCDDSARAEFLNTREFKAKHGAPKQSNSNLWFVEPETLDKLGPSIGRGNVWLNEDISAGATSDPFLFNGYDYQQLHLGHKSTDAVEFVLEVDRNGDNTWETLAKISVGPNQPISKVFSSNERAAWIRVKPLSDSPGTTANFQFRNRDLRSADNDSLFAGIATPTNNASSFGLMRSLSYDRLGLVASANQDGTNASFYELKQNMELVPVDDPTAANELVAAVAQPTSAVTVDKASVIIEEDGKRYRLPKNAMYEDSSETAIKNSGQGKKTLRGYLKESLAINSQCRSNSIHKDYSPGNAVDGVFGEDSRWVSSKTGSGWLELTMDRPQTIKTIWVVSGWNSDRAHVARNFDIQTMQESNWVTIPGGQVRDNQQVEREIVLKDALTTSQLRLVSKDEGHTRIYELALFDRELDISPVSESGKFAVARICREVATERDLLNVHGTFYELPARNAQGLAKLRPIATHNLAIHDFCSHAGLLFFTGVDGSTKSEHIFRSADEKAAVWAGVVDDLWKLGKPRGSGGPWKDSVVKANEPSDPYLMTAFDKKSVEITTTSLARIRIEVDVDGTGVWMPYRAFDVTAGNTVHYDFPEGFSAYWVRAVSEQATTASVIFYYR